MSFITKPDFSNNRQVKQFQLSSTQLSGTTIFGVDDVLIPLNITGDTINIDALQNIRTRGLILPISLSTFTGATYQLLGRDDSSGKIVEITSINEQATITGDTTITSTLNDVKLFLNPLKDININVDHLQLVTNHENYFINESAFNVNFVPSVANSTNVITTNGLILLPNGTAYLIRKGSENKIYLNISN